MSDNTCECAKPTIKATVRGIEVDIDASILDNIPIQPSSGGIDYSYDEQWTGRRWVDGRKVYQKTIKFGGLMNSTVKQVPHGVANLDLAIECKGIAKNPANGVVMIMTFVNPYAPEQSISIQVDPTYIMAATKLANHTPYTESYFTISYICKDR